MQQVARDPFEGLHDVPEAQMWVDGQLRNWHDWLAAGGGGGGETSPMFRNVRNDREAVYGASTTRPAADEARALLVERAVAYMPAMHRAALRWFYVKGGSPYRVAKATVGKFHLVGLLRDARAQLDATLRADAAVKSAQATSKLRSRLVPVA